MEDNSSQEVNDLSNEEDPIELVLKLKSKLEA